MTVMTDVEQWESDVRRFLKKSSTQTRAATLRGLRVSFAKPDPVACGMYLSEQLRFSVWAKPGGEAYVEAVKRLEQEFGGDA